MQEILQTKPFYMFDTRLQELHKINHGATVDLQGKDDHYDCPEVPDRT